MKVRAAVFAPLLVALSAAAAPLGPDATRAESERWLAGLGRDGVAVGGEVRWQYVFSAADTRRLEGLSVALVRAGYEIVSLDAAPSGAALLRVARRELHSPRSLERRSQELAALARAHAARYEGVDAPSGARP